MAAAILTTPKSVAPAEFETELADMDAGVLKDIPAKSTLSINGVVMTGAQIDAKLKGYIATIQAADAAKQQAAAAVTARVNMTVEGRDFYQQLKKAVIASFGAQSPQLDDFGLAPAKAKAPKTSAEKAITAAKAKLTRDARGTGSKKQKAAINPNQGTPAVAIGPNAEPVAIGAIVVNPGTPVASSSTAPAGSTTAASSTTATSASAPAPAGSGGPASGA
jgi:hypothetical protein